MRPSESFLLAVTRIEGSVGLDVVGADVSHEIAHTLNVLHNIVDDAAAGRPLAEDDIALGRREIERIERMMGRLRRLRLPPPVRDPVRVLDTLRQIEADSVDLRLEKQVTLSIVAPVDVTLHAEHHILYILLRDVLEHVIRRAASGQVQVTLDDEHGDKALDVWSGTSAALPPSQAARFSPWASPPEGGGGLGLAVAFRIARSLGWGMAPIDIAGRDGLRILIPARSLFPEVGR